VQLGTIYEQWVREYMPAAKICLKNTTIHCVEALKAGHVDGVVLDLPQAKIFVKKNRILGFSALDTDRRGFVIAFKKDSYLKKEFDIIITKLKDNGEIKNLINKHINSAYNG
jgi:polar amino acid transport system substrate-binding protein